MIGFLHRFVDSDSRYQYYWGGGDVSKSKYMEPYVADLNDKAEFNGYGFGDDSYAPCTYIESYNYGSNNVTTFLLPFKMTINGTIETEANALSIPSATLPSPLFGDSFYLEDGYSGVGYHIFTNHLKLTHGRAWYKTISYATPINKYFQVKLTPTELYIDDNLTETHPKPTLPFYDNLRIFITKGATYFLRGRLHYFRYKEGECLTHNLVPLYSKKLKRYGVYDTQTKEWITNSNYVTYPFRGGIEPEYTT